MGSWLFSCFGGGRRERLPRLCSARNNRHHRSREYVKTLPPPSAPTRPLLLQNSEHLPHPPYRCDPRLGGVGAPSNDKHCQLKPDRESVTAERNQLRGLGEELASRGCSVQPVPDDATTLRHRLSVPASVQAPQRYTSSCIHEDEDDDVQTPPVAALSCAVEESTCTAEKTSSAQSEEVEAEWGSSPETEPVAQQKPKVPRAAAPGFIMFPRKRSMGYRSSVWQEPLSPVAESESSISSEEAAGEAEVVTWCAGSKYSGTQCSGSGETTPIRCSSPVLDDKENMFVSAGDKGGGRLNQASVLTPVGNLMQWRQLKQERKYFHKATTGDEDRRESGWDEAEAEDDDDAEKYSFFKELQESSSDLTPPPPPPPQQPQMCAADSGGTGFLPNTTRKYMEDQKVAWHSTPFEVRLDKALACGSAAPGRTVLF